MANRIDETFSRLRAQDRAAFVAYICAGDPTLPKSLEIARALVANGVDVLEFGLPFSDPLADGSVNQAAAQRALEAGATVRGVLAMIREFRQTDATTPVVLYAYMNPVYQYGFRQFHEDCVTHGVDGLLLLDLPPEEAERNPELVFPREVHWITLVAPTTRDDRFQKIAKQAQGFIYYVSREGVTGERSELAADLDAQVRHLKSMCDVPLAVGFGISTPEQAQIVAELADGVIVGSAIVRRIEQHGAEPDVAERLGAFVKPIAEAIHGARVAA
jgi:tryptophan synthase alpha chain